MMLRLRACALTRASAPAASAIAHGLRIYVADAAAATKIRKGRSTRSRSAPLVGHRPRKQILRRGGDAPHRWVVGEDSVEYTAAEAAACRPAVRIAAAAAQHHREPLSKIEADAHRHAEED